MRKTFHLVSSVIERLDKRRHLMSIASTIKDKAQAVQKPVLSLSEENEGQNCLPPATGIQTTFVCRDTKGDILL